MVPSHGLLFLGPIPGNCYEISSEILKKQYHPLNHETILKHNDGTWQWLKLLDNYINSTHHLRIRFHEIQNTIANLIIVV